jgi:hypothetical protein
MTENTKAKKSEEMTIEAGADNSSQIKSAVKQTVLEIMQKELNEKTAQSKVAGVTPLEYIELKAQIGMLYDLANKIVAGLN